MYPHKKTVKNKKRDDKDVLILIDANERMSKIIPQINTVVTPSSAVRLNNMPPEKNMATFITG